MAQSRLESRINPVLGNDALVTG